MSSETVSPAAVQPVPRWVHRFAVVTACATLGLIFVGGLVTSTGSGLAVPDWPLSFGQVFPPMVGGVLYEHGHRLVGRVGGCADGDPGGVVGELGAARLGSPFGLGRVGCGVGAGLARRIDGVVAIADGGVGGACVFGATVSMFDG